MSAHSYRFGIEEEYFLADAETRGTPRATWPSFHAAAPKARLPETGRELLASARSRSARPRSPISREAARDNLGEPAGRHSAGIARRARPEPALRLPAPTRSPAGRARAATDRRRAIAASCRDVGIVGPGER